VGWFDLLAVGSEWDVIDYYFFFRLSATISRWGVVSPTDGATNNALPKVDFLIYCYSKQMRSHMCRQFVTISFFVLYFVSAHTDAAVKEVPTQYPTLKLALSAASRCDTILIDSGVFSEPGFREIYFFANQCVWISTKYGPQMTTIDLGGSYFCDGQLGAGRGSDNIVIQGVRFVNGNPGVKYCEQCEMIIADCIFDSNDVGIDASMYGGADIGGVFRTIFKSNGVAINGSQEAWLSVGDCLFLNNVEGIVGGVLPGYSVYNCTFIGNTFAAYHAVEYQLGFLYNNVFYLNGYGIFSESDPSYWNNRFFCNDVYGNIANYVGVPSMTGTNGNISVDPKFCWADFHKIEVASISPLLANNNGCHLRIGIPSQVSCFCGDVDVSGNVDIGDISAIISYLYLSGPPPVPLGAGEIDGQAPIDIADLSKLIDYLYISLQPLPCGI
jgi:hypothetical protein